MKNVIIAAGGTGGHINAALSLGEVLNTKSYNVIYISGQRHLDYKLFNDKNVLHLSARPLRVKNPLKILINTFLNLMMFINLLIKILKFNPGFIIGCGGYICGPVLLAGYLMFKKTYVVEQNAIAGLTNKLLSKISNINFLNFEDTKGISRNTVVAGNPVRSNIKFSDIKQPNNEINILVFGGSLGASQINEVIYKYLDIKDSKIKIRHQVGKGNSRETDKDGYEQLEYIDDIQKDYEWANIIISRAGASTVSELEIIQKPVILIPYPAAVDNHQYYNAKALKNKVSFFVKIVDHKQDLATMTKEVENTINQIISENLFIPKTVKPRLNSADEIVRKIELDVGNK